MTSDLQSALDQLKPLLGYNLNEDQESRVQQAIKAIERCVEVAPVYLAAFDAHNGAFDNEARRIRMEAESRRADFTNVLPDAKEVG